MKKKKKKKKTTTNKQYLNYFTLIINTGPAELGYALPLQTDLHCIPLDI